MNKQQIKPPKIENTGSKPQRPWNIKENFNGMF